VSEYNVQREDLKKKGEFFVEDDDGKRVARLQYFHSRDGEIKVFHTEVDASLSGKGIGRKLVAAAVEFARKNHLKILPTCSYAKKVLDETPAFHDVLA
jgi:predicted GNAT family acetyltransferase